MRTTPIILVCSSLFLACGGEKAASDEIAQGYTAADAELALAAELPPFTDPLPEPQSTAEPPQAVASSEDPSSSSDESASSHTIIIRSGENLVSLSEWANTTPTQLADLNEMDVQATLFAGEKLNLALSEEELANFEVERGSALDTRLDRYIEARGGLYTVEAHSMRSGQTVWGVAKDQGALPMWVVSAFNEDLNLNRLGIGDIVTLPVMVDTVQASIEAGVETEESSENEPTVAPF